MHPRFARALEAASHAIDVASHVVLLPGEQAWLDTRRALVAARRNAQSVRLDTGDDSAHRAAQAAVREHDRAGEHAGYCEIMPDGTVQITSERRRPDPARLAAADQAYRDAETAMTLERRRIEDVRTTRRMRRQWYGTDPLARDPASRHEDRQLRAEWIRRTRKADRARTIPGSLCSWLPYLQARANQISLELDAVRAVAPWTAPDVVWHAWYAEHVAPLVTRHAELRAELDAAYKRRSQRKAARTQGLDPLLALGRIVDRQKEAARRRNARALTLCETDVRRAWRLAQYRVVQGKWAGGDHTISVEVGTPHVYTSTSRVWSKNGKWSGLDAHTTIRVSSTWHTLPVELRVVERRLTLDATPCADARANEDAYDAAWAEQAAGVQLRVAQGVIYRRQVRDGGAWLPWVHAGSLRGARQVYARQLAKVSAALTEVTQ